MAAKFMFEFIVDLLEAGDITESDNIYITAIFNL